MEIIVENKNLVVVNHPLIQHKISMIRDKKTKDKQFREIVEELGALLFYEASRDLNLKEKKVETPICETISQIISDEIAIVAIFRAAIGMQNGILDVMPSAKVGHVGLYRDPETLNPVEYYCKLPKDICERKIFIVDPMLATGGSAIATIKFLEARGVNVNNGIIFLCLIAAPEGIEKINKVYPGVKIYAAALDEKLNENGYIVPGLGDAGDRLFGTK